ncbi:MAG: beta-ketoacyl-ACP synthase [Gammaproteobacteria bacterium]|nr:beta-ketoacyl-ACP synthase [Gammaproteobacteria bacterium]
MNRVVVTGFGGVSSIGNDWNTIEASLQAKKTGIQLMSEWQTVDGLNTALGGPVEGFKRPAHYSRKQVRAMGRVAMMSTVATEDALKDAGLLDDPAIKDGRTGISYGSSGGSVAPISAFAKLSDHQDMSGITSTTYIQMMNHTCAVNIAIFFGLKGRVIPTSSACTSGSQGIGYAYEAIKSGHQQIMIAGGAEEISVNGAAIFDTLYATSVKNDTPELTPRPFDKDRDGLVIGEGAGTLILEELEHAKARGAKIYAEVVGYGTNCDGNHVTQPTSDTMKVAMQLALNDANLPPTVIGYVSAHGTATDRGDVAESRATNHVFDDHVPISSMKSYLGHTLGACGAIEAWWAIEMMNRDTFYPTANLDNVDPDCADLDYIQAAPRSINTEYIMSNNFAFGGINTSLIFKRWP